MLFILGHFGNQDGFQIDIGTSLGSHGSPRRPPERPGVPFGLIFGLCLGHVWEIFGSKMTFLGNFNFFKFEDWRFDNNFNLNRIKTMQKKRHKK